MAKILSYEAFTAYADRVGWKGFNQRNHASIVLATEGLIDPAT